MSESGVTALSVSADSTPSQTTTADMPPFTAADDVDWRLLVDLKPVGNRVCWNHSLWVPQSVSEQGASFLKR